MPPEGPSLAMHYVAQSATGTASSRLPLLTALVFLVGFNLQSGIFIVGPLLPDLSRDLAISGSNAGALAAIPALMMGLGAIPGGALTRKRGPTRTIGLGMAIIGVAGAVRGLVPGWPALVVLTVLFGAGIGIMQPAGPAFIRQRFGDRVGSVTSVYTFGLVTGIIVASGLAGPVIVPLTGGWRGSLVIWGTIAIVTAALWIATTRACQSDSPIPVDAGDPVANRGLAWSPWRDRVIWLGAALYASQGFVFFLLGLWLPAVYAEAGLSSRAIGARMMVLTASSLPAIVLMPAWADRIGSWRLPLVVSASLTLAGAIGFVVATTSAPLDWLWPFLVGSGVGGILVLVLVLVAVVATPERTGSAAAMVLAVGYVSTALGPFLAGVLRDLSGGFQTALLVLPVVAVAMLLLSLAMPRSGQDTGEVS